MTTMAMTFEPTFTQPHVLVMNDTSLPQTARMMYNALLQNVDKKTNITRISDKKLAAKLDRSIRTLQRASKVLQERGIIERISRYNKDGWQITNDYLIVGARAKCYEGSKEGFYLNKNQQNQPRQKSRARSDKNAEPLYIDSYDSDNNSEEGSYTPHSNIYEGEEKNTTTENLISQPQGFETQGTIDKAEFSQELEAGAESECSAANDTAVLDLSDVPEVLRPTAKYMLMRSGRNVLSTREIMRLRQLGEVHTPTRIQKEIDRASERFEAENKPLRCLSFNYIWAALQHQVSRKRVKKTKKSKYERLTKDDYWKRFAFEQAKQLEAEFDAERAKQLALQSNAETPIAQTTAPETEPQIPAVMPGVSLAASEAEQLQPAQPVSVSESAKTEIAIDDANLPMTVEEAKKVIAEGTHKQNAEENIPEAQRKLLENIAAWRQKVISESEVKEDVVESDDLDENQQYRLFDDNGEPVVYEHTQEVDVPEKFKPREPMPLLDYLKLKFPDESDEVCSRYSCHDEVLLCDARDIDEACANCSGSEDYDCVLPMLGQYDIGKVRPNACIEKGPRGDKRISVRFGGCIKCRYGRGEKQKADSEFERKLKKSKLTERQTNQTLEAYKHSTPETTVAKALAILAAKNNKSLILAGNPGSGKTHLAIGVAIEAMKNGRQAIVENAPEMLDNLRRVAREHTDFFGLMQKYKDVSCLVIDDLGKERSTEASNDYLYQIIDYRYRHGLQTIVTTNALEPEKLYKPWTEKTMKPIISRLLENGDWITITDTADHRTEALI